MGTALFYMFADTLSQKRNVEVVGAADMPRLNSHSDVTWFLERSQVTGGCGQGQEIFKEGVTFVNLVTETPLQAPAFRQVHGEKHVLAIPPSHCGEGYLIAFFALSSSVDATIHIV